MNEAPQPGAETRPTVKNVTLHEIFFLFFQIGALSFGGGLVAWVYREVVEHRKWLTEAEFLGGLTLAQVLPGINMTNMAVYVGQRMRGVAGATVAVSGLLLLPFFFVIGLVSVYGQIEANPDLQAFMDGLATTAVGLFLSVGIKSVRSNIKGAAPLAIMAAIFVMVGVLRWPLVPVVLCLAPISVALAWRRGNSHA